MKIKRAEASNEAEVPEQSRKKVFDKISKLNIIQAGGTDLQGRTIVQFSACRLPGKGVINMDTLIEYIVIELEKVVENDYVLVYFHAGLSPDCRPDIAWVYRVWSTLSRSYKKNLKNLYIVHPSVWVRALIALTRPFVSPKFYSKIFYCKKLSQLAAHVPLSQLDVPDLVLEHDRRHGSKGGDLDQTVQDTGSFQVFGARLESLVSPDQPIPLVLLKAKARLTSPDVIDMEGLMRRSASTTAIVNLKDKINNGMAVDWTTMDGHTAAVLFKAFLRELPEPLLTFDLYDTIIAYGAAASSGPMVDQLSAILKRLPDANRAVLAFVVETMAEIAAHSDNNKMTMSNLVLVVAPNLLWSDTQVPSLEALQCVSTLLQHLCDARHEVFPVCDSTTDSSIK